MISHHEPFFASLRLINALGGTAITEAPDEQSSEQIGGYFVSSASAGNRLGPGVAAGPLLAAKDLWDAVIATARRRAS